jgi:uncharacterized protein
MRILNLTRSSILATNAQIATTENARVLGLLTSKGLQPGEALIIPKCNAVHTVGMLFTIDVVFFNPQTSSIIECFTLKPGYVWKMPKYPLSMCSVLELPEGTIELTGSKPGDLLELASEG